MSQTLDRAHRMAARRIFLRVPDMMNDPRPPGAIWPELPDRTQHLFLIFADHMGRIAPHYRMPQHLDEQWHVARMVVYGLSIGGTIQDAENELAQYAQTWGNTFRSHQLAQELVAEIVQFITQVEHNKNDR